MNARRVFMENLSCDEDAIIVMVFLRGVEKEDTSFPRKRSDRIDIFIVLSLLLLLPALVLC